MKQRMVPLSLKVILIIVGSQLLLYVLFAFMILQGSRDAINASEEDSFRLLGEVIRWSIDDELSSAELVLDYLSQDSELTELFAQRDRRGLYDHLKEKYSSIQDRVVRFHFYLPDGTSFLRMHNPERYGDKLLELRPMVRDVFRLKQTVRGIEQGEDGLGLRVIRPLYQNGECIGAVELGMEFGSAFVAKLQKKFGGQYYIFLFDSPQTYSLVAGTLEKPRCPTAERLLEPITLGMPQLVLDCSYAQAVGLYPFRDYSGAVIGFIKAELSKIPLSNVFETIQERLFLLALVLVLSLLGASLFAMNGFLRPLDEVVSKTNLISEKILSGDVSYRGSISHGAAEYQKIIEAVNTIIDALRERENLLRAIVEGIPGIVYYVDRTYRVLWANELTRIRFPNIETEYLHAYATGFFAQERELLIRTFNSLTIEQVDACYVKNGGEQECWEHVAVPIFDSEHRVSNVIRISRNITDKRKVEWELRELNENLEHRVEEEIQRRQEGERLAEQQSRLAAIGELATGMAHEITQPLNAIAFSIENIRNRYTLGNLDRDYLDKKHHAIVSDIERVRRVIEHIRLFARG